MQVGHKRKETAIYQNNHKLKEGRQKEFRHSETDTSILLQFSKLERGSRLENQDSIALKLPSTYN